MERHAIGFEAEAMRVIENIGRHFGRATEFARERPFGTGTIAENPAEYLCARSSAGNLLDFRRAINRKEANAALEGTGNVAFFLDRVPEGNTIRLGAGRQCHLDFGHRGRIEAGAKRGQEAQNGRVRIGLYRIKNACIRH